MRLNALILLLFHEHDNLGYEKLIYTFSQKHSKKLSLIFIIDTSRNTFYVTYERGYRKYTRKYNNIDLAS